MNKIYDKLILAVAVLVLAGGVFLYLQKSGATPSLTEPVNTQAADNPYQPVPFTPAESAEANWPEVTAQPSGPLWIYDVFTPPKIYIDLATGEFTADPPVEPIPEPPFGVYLAEIKRKPYRLQLEGYIEEDRSDPSKTLLLMYDEEAQKQVRARPGDEKPEAGFTLQGFDIQRIREGGSIEVVAKATILDQRSGEEVVLVHGERRYEAGLTVMIRSEQDASYLKVLTDAPVEFEGPIGQYTLLEINLEESSVKVEKHGVDDQEPVVQTLSARGSSAPATPSSQDTSPNKETNEEDEETLDFMFE